MCQENLEEPRSAAEQFLKGGLSGHVIGSGSPPGSCAIQGAATAFSVGPPPAGTGTELLLCSESAILLIKSNHWIPGPVEQS